MKRIAVMVGLLSLLPASQALAAPPVDDSEQGVTCYFYSAAARLEWERRGGDWTDARGTSHGSEPFSVVPVPRLDGQQAVHIDVTALAKHWLGEGTPEAAIFLRDTQAGGVVNFASREHPSPSSRPSLVIEWSNGTRSRLAARADTYFSCPNHRSYGQEQQIKVGGRHAALLVFPIAEAPSGAVVRSASLMLTSDKQYGKGATVGAFLPRLPGSRIKQVETGLAQAFDRDQGISGHPDVIHTEGVDERPGFLPWGSLDMGLGGRTVTSDSANRFEPLEGSALAVKIAKGANSGLNTHLRFADYKGGEPDEAYFRYYLRFGESWDPTVDGGKLPGLSGIYGRGGWGMRKSDGANGWSARGAFFRQSGGLAADLRGIGSYVYHAGMQGNSGDTWGWSLGPSGLLHKNRWYAIEQYVKLNTPGKADGVLRAWIDGQLVFERQDIRYRDTDLLKIESVWLNVYHGGIQAAVQDMTLFIDNLVVARKYIGPMKGHAQ